MNFAISRVAKGVSKAKVIRSSSAGVVSVTNRFSSTALTKEEIEVGLKRNEAYRVHARKQTMPITLSDAYGTGEELHQPADPSETAVFSGMPAEHANRKVLISQRQNKSVQSSDCFSHQWRISWQDSARWSDQLMGWTSTSDPMSNVQLDFDNQADAIAFAERNGWKYETTKAQEAAMVPTGTNKYAHNFLSPLKIAEVKYDLDNYGRTDEFVAPGWGQSQFFMPLTYHGDAEVDQYGPEKSKAKANAK